MSQKHLSEREYDEAAELRLALRSFHARSDATVRRHGLTPKRYELLLLVKVSDPAEATVGHLGARLSIGQSAATQLVRRAEDDGVLERQLSRRDARVQHLRLTEEGERRLAGALADLGPERRELINILASLR
ncbi:MAG TPA: MarR family transcriptional regulator [Gaiellaceae bacterium]|nr:MarR family transcriptional regulator [Gaiellaceae bacterium]